MKEPLSETLIHIAAVIEQGAARILKDNAMAVTYNQFKLLSALYQSGPSTQHALAIKLGHSDAPVSRMIARLAVEGYLRQEQDDSHKRKNRVQLTKTGEQVVISCAHILDEAFQQSLTGLDIDVRHYAQASRRLLAHMQNAVT